MITFTSATDAKASIADAIEASGVVEDARAGYNIDSIFDTTHTFDTGRQVFIQTDNHDVFWAAVEANVQ